MISNSIYIIFEYDIILLNMKYSIKYIISFRLVYESIKSKYIYIKINRISRINRIKKKE